MFRQSRRRTNAESEKQHGPSLLNALARSPAVLAGYIGLHEGLAQGRLSAAERCLVGLKVAQCSGSSYCLSVQSSLARKAGLTMEQIAAAREGCAGSDRQVALLFLAGKLVINRGELAGADLAAVRQAGLSDSEIMEVIFHVTLNLSAAAVSHAAPEAGFPACPAAARFLEAPPRRMSSAQGVTEFFEHSWRPAKLIKSRQPALRAGISGRILGTLRMLDPTPNASRTIESEARGASNGTFKGGRRKFGDACQDNKQASRVSNPHFLVRGCDGTIACQILLLPGFEINELSALTEALECANRVLGERLFDWHLASLDGAPVRSAGSLPVAVARAAQNGDPRHLFLLSAYGGADIAKPALSALLCRRYALGTRIAGIGGACVLLAEAGLLNARPCAAHWSLADALMERAPSLEVADRLYVVDERIATCAGRGATLDFALRLIADAAGERLSRIVADSLNHARPREATERQLSELDFSGQRGASAIAHTVAAMRRRMTEGEDLDGIAAQSGVSQRQLQRLFRRHLGMTPTQYFLKARLQRARHLLQYSTLSVTEIAIATGFASISHFTRRYTELYGRTPTAERGRTPRRARDEAIAKHAFSPARSAA